MFVMGDGMSLDSNQSPFTWETSSMDSKRKTQNNCDHDDASTTTDATRLLPPTGSINKLNNKQPCLYSLSFETDITGRLALCLCGWTAGFGAPNRSRNARYVLLVACLVP